VQLADFVTQTHESLMMKGMKAPAADLYYGLPLWMKVPSRSAAWAAWSAASC
jgi:hypothetical protein